MGEIIEALTKFWSNYWLLGIPVAYGYVCVIFAIHERLLDEYEFRKPNERDSFVKDYQTEQDAEVEDWISKLPIEHRLMAVRAQAA